jgi:hypothetical protein
MDDLNRLQAGVRHAVEKAFTGPEDDRDDVKDQLVDRVRVSACRTIPGTNSGNVGTTSITFRVRRASRNVMKPRIQRVLTQ